MNCNLDMSIQKYYNYELLLKIFDIIDNHKFLSNIVSRTILDTEYSIYDTTFNLGKEYHDMFTYCKQSLIQITSDDMKNDKQLQYWSKAMQSIINTSNFNASNIDRINKIFHQYTVSLNTYIDYQLYNIENRIDIWHMLLHKNIPLKIYVHMLCGKYIAIYNSNAPIVRIVDRINELYREIFSMINSVYIPLNKIHQIDIDENNMNKYFMDLYTALSMQYGINTGLIKFTYTEELTDAVKKLLLSENEIRLSMPILLTISDVIKYDCEQSNIDEEQTAKIYADIFNEIRNIK